MHKSKMFFLIGILMFIIMVLFIAYALQHPESSFAFDLRITYMMYFIYLMIMIVMFILAAKN